MMRSLFMHENTATASACIMAPRCCPSCRCRRHCRARQRPRLACSLGATGCRCRTLPRSLASWARPSRVRPHRWCPVLGAGVSAGCRLPGNRDVLLPHPSQVVIIIGAPVPCARCALIRVHFENLGLCVPHPAQIITSWVRPSSVRPAPLIRFVTCGSLTFRCRTPSRSPATWARLFPAGPVWLPRFFESLIWGSWCCG